MTLALFTFACWFAAMCFVDGWPGNAFTQFLYRTIGAVSVTTAIFVVAALI